MNPCLRKILTSLLAGFVWLCVSENVQAMPSLQDHWRFFCAPFGYSQKVMTRAKAASQARGLKGAVGSLQLACVQSALEVAQFEKATLKFREQGGQGNAPQLNQRQSQNMVRQASARLRAVYEKQQKNPEAIYHHAYALALLGDDWAVNRFDDIMSQFPKSPFASDAALALAEYFFDKTGMAQSQEYYTRAVKAKKPIVQMYARYKLAWINYITGAQSQSPEKQKQAIYQLAQLSKRTRSGGGIVKGLGDKIKTDVVDLAVDFGDIAEAQRILRSVGATDLYSSLLERMAYAKLAGGDTTSSYRLFELALKENIKSPSAPELHGNLVALAVQLGNMQLLVGNLKNMVAAYLNPKAPWRLANKNKKLVQRTTRKVEDLVFEYATALDRDGRDSNNPANLGLALELYELFLARFGKVGRAYDVEFFRSQLLFTLQRHLDAAKAILTMIKARPKGKHVKDSLEILVTAAQTAVDNDKTQYKYPAPGSMKKPAKIPEIKQVYADALDRFTKYLPTNTNSPAMIYAAASVYYDFGAYKEANKRYLAFVRRYPNNSFAKIAAARLFEYQKLQGTKKSYAALKERLSGIGPIRSSPELASYFALPEKPEKKKSQKKPPAAIADEQTEQQSDLAPVSEASQSADGTDQEAENAPEEESAYEE